MRKATEPDQLGMYPGRTVTMQVPPPAERRSRARWWALAGLIGLAIAWDVGVFVAAGSRLRGTHHGPGRQLPAPARSPEAAPVPAPAIATAVRNDQPSPRAPEPLRPLVAEHRPAPSPPESRQPAATAADERPAVSRLVERRPAAAAPQPGAVAPPERPVRSPGAELFARSWLPNDPRCHGGDGLGPVYNATSCRDCHNQGGPGGGGPAERNVQLATGIGYMAAPDTPVVVNGNVVAGNVGLDMVSTNPEPADLVRVHPGFRDAKSIVLHHFGVDPDYAGWRAEFLTQCRHASPINGVSISRSASIGRSASVDRSVSVGRSRHRHAIVRATSTDESSATLSAPPIPPELADQLSAACRVAAGSLGMNRVAFSLTARNAPPLYGAGLIDAVPDGELERIARHEPANVRGRVHRLKDGRAGRFGWKAQVGGLEEFVLTACANELGLEVPGHHQALSPLDPGAAAARPDLTAEECAALVSYVRDLPAPVSLAATGADGVHADDEGRRLFGAIGCASCHASDVGAVRGIYSDLLLHDMGESLSDPGTYYGDDSTSLGAATRGEWRTPPLWGVKDSAPYLHDGRARSLGQAIALHGGQGAASAVRFRTLEPVQQSQILAFLNALAAPDASPAAQVLAAAPGALGPDAPR